MLKTTFRQQLIAGFLLALLVVLTINFFSYVSIQEYGNNADLVNHTQDVMGTSAAVLAELVNAETGQRGYLLTAQERYLEPYMQAVAILPSKLDKLRNLVSDNPAQTKRVDSLSILVYQRLDILKETLLLRETQGLQAALDNMVTDKGKNLTDKIRRMQQEINEDERQLLTARENTAAGYALQAKGFIYTGVAIILIIMGLMLAYILRTFNMQRAAEQRVKESNVRLQELSSENARQNWLLTGSDQLNEQLRGENSVEALCAKIINSLCEYCGGHVGAVYLYDEDTRTLVPTAGFAHDRIDRTKRIAVGEGLLGQVAIHQRLQVLDELPGDYIKVQSSLGAMAPSHLIISPIRIGSHLKAVVEIGFTGNKDNRRKDLLEMVGENIAISIQVAQARENMRRLLEQVQLQSEELETQQEELRQTNDELSRQTELLQASEEELRVQQEELRQTNTELEEKASLLEERNRTVEEAREAIINKAEELELTNRYKSEFLANMSHELRTPLNSILILAELLGNNRKGHLDQEEVKYAKVVYNAGNDLLNLINDILDLSKIESGKLDLHMEEVSIKEISSNMQQLFAQLALNKKITFKTTVSTELPKFIETDRQRVEQIIRNLLSNAFKFTPEDGKVTLKFGADGENLVIAVQDTGIGIAEDKKEVIFEAFKQADGSTNRKYGGTGLGLSISRELAHLLGGRIELDSVEGTGSTFRLILPLERKEIAGDSIVPTAVPERLTTPARVQLPMQQDDRSLLSEEDKTILIVEDDPAFAEILLSYAHRKGFKAILARNGQDGLTHAREYLPDAIILDIMLPLKGGWDVLRELKSDERLKQIPVHVMSGNDSNIVAFRDSGALSFNQKPVEKETLENIFTGLEWDFNPRHNQVLLVEDQLLQSNLMKDALIEQGFLVHQAFDGNETMELLAQNEYDCLILDLNLPDTKGLELLARIKSDEKHYSLPVIINTASDLSPEMHDSIRKYSNALVMKSKRSNERLLDEVKLFMHKVKKDKPSSSHLLKTRSTTLEKTLKGKKVLLVDDDMRNIFALSSSLQQYELEVEIAGNGVEAMEALKKHRDFDLVLMDIMMPEMDGYEAMRRIRKDSHYKEIPVIALTAKAMKSDREKCLEAGASDYIPKPVDMDRLLSMMRVWLSR